MNVQQWLDQPGKEFSGVRLSRKTGLGPPIISRILHGKLSVSLVSALKLDKGTAGEIRAEEVCPEYAELIAHLRGAPA